MCINIGIFHVLNLDKYPIFGMIDWVKTHLMFLRIVGISLALCLVRGCVMERCWCDDLC